MTPRLSVSLTLLRPGPDGLEVFWARRRADRRFLGGFHAFFAGSVESYDDDEGMAALRECYEECGLLLTSQGMRRVGILDRTHDYFVENLDKSATSRLHHFGWWTTPPWLKPSFTTSFFGLLLSDEEGRSLDDLSDHLDRREFDQGTWICASEALEQWRRCQAFLTTPLSQILRSLAETPARAEELPTPMGFGSTRAKAGTAWATEICGGLVLIPLKTPTVPPATHTNAVVVGHRRFVVIDPGPSKSADLRPLLESIEARRAGGDEFVGILLTHHHVDHIGGLGILGEEFDVPLMAHRETLARVEGWPNPTEEICDGDELPVDLQSPVTALFTPGHAPGHLAFHLRAEGLLIAGDLVASRGTIMIDPRQGNMGEYLASLGRIRDIAPAAILPSHGSLIANPVELVDHYISHRLWREEMVLQALGEAGRAGAAALVARVYDDVPPVAWPFARLSLLAHLEHLVERGLAGREGDEFWVMGIGDRDR